MKEKYLPIGSVVMLKNGKKRLMITGYTQIDMEKRDRMFDYCGVLYPQGVIATDNVLLFNHEDIEKIYAIGYSDEEQQEFMKKIKELLTEENIEKLLKEKQVKPESLE